MVVKVYSTPVCPWCEVVKDFLSSHNISFEDIDVSVDEKAAQEIVKKSGQIGVPVIEIDGRIIVGFNKPLLEETLGINKTEEEKKDSI